MHCPNDDVQHISTATQNYDIFDLTFGTNILCYRYSYSYSTPFDLCVYANWIKQKKIMILSCTENSVSFQFLVNEEPKPTRNGSQDLCSCWLQKIVSIEVVHELNSASNVCTCLFQPYGKNNLSIWRNLITAQQFQLFLVITHYDYPRWMEQNDKWNQLTLNWRKQKRVSRTI